MCQIPELKRNVKFQQVNMKDNAKSLEFKEHGNAACKLRDFKEAIKLYTKSITYSLDTPDNQVSCIGYTNRSAALFDIEYTSAERDIDIAVSSGYPRDKQSKLMEWKAKCVELVAQTMKDTPQEDVSLNKLRNMHISDGISDCANIPGVDFGASHQVPSASSVIHLEHSTDIGRNFIADRDIPIDSVLMVECPYASLLALSAWETHCYHCFSRLPLDDLPCDGCVEVRFCDQSCMNASKTYHQQYECPVIRTLTGILRRCAWLPMLAFRMLIVTGIETIINTVANQNHEFCCELLPCMRILDGS